MIITERRLYVKVHRQALRQTMTYRGFTVRGLAEATRKPRISRSTIGHLVSGQRSTASPETARAIERALDVAPGTIFQPSVCDVRTHVAPKDAA